MGAATDTDLDLEQLVEDEVPCGIRNHGALGVVCSVEVTHLFDPACRDAPATVCGNAAMYVIQVLAASWGRCSHCHSATSVCWAIRPI